MRKINFLLIGLLMVCILAMGVNATVTITVTAPASNGVVTSTYNFTATISAFLADANITNCSFATTDDGVFAWTRWLGNTSSYWNQTDSSTLTGTTSTTVTVKCYNYSNGALLGTGTVTGVQIDNTDPVCSCNLGRTRVSLFQPIDYDCSASSDAYTTITYSCVATYADSSTETETSVLGKFEDTNAGEKLGEVSVACTITDGASRTNTCSTLNAIIAGDGEEPVEEPPAEKEGLSQKQKGLIFILFLVVIVIAVMAFSIIKGSKEKRSKRKG